MIADRISTAHVAGHHGVHRRAFARLLVVACALSVRPAAAQQRPAARGAPGHVARLADCAALADSMARAASRASHVSHAVITDAMRAAADTARAAGLGACLAGVRHTALHTDQLPQLVTLEAESFAWEAADSLAALFVRRAGPDAARKATALVTVMDAMALSRTGAPGRARIRSYAARIASFGVPAVPERVQALEHLVTYGEESSEARVRDAHEALALAATLPQHERRALVESIARSYIFLAETAANDLDPDSAKATSARGVAEIAALGYVGGDTALRFLFARVLAATAQRYALIGAPAARFTGGTWLNAGGGSVAFPSPGAVGLVEFTADWCGPCRASYPTLAQFARTYASRGLKLVLATSMGTEFGGKVLSRGEWLAAARAYYADEARVPFPVHVAAPDSPVADGAPDGEGYGVEGLPQIVLIDRGGRVRQILLDWNAQTATRLGPAIEALLSEPPPSGCARRIMNRARRAQWGSGTPQELEMARVHIVTSEEADGAVCRRGRWSGRPRVQRAGSTRVGRSRRCGQVLQRIPTHSPRGARERHRRPLLLGAARHCARSDRGLRRRRSPR